MTDHDPTAGRWCPCPDCVRQAHEVGAGARRVAMRHHIRIGWVWGDPEWPDLPPAVITTDRVKRDFDMLRVRMGLPPLHFPEPSDPSDLFDRIRSGVRVDKCEPLTEESFRDAVDQMRYVQPMPRPQTIVMSPGGVRQLQATAEHWRERERELNYELHRLARGWSKLRLLKRWRRYKQHHAAAGNARAFAPYLAARERFNV